MDSAPGNDKRKCNRALDLLLLVGAGLVVAAVGTAAFWIADNHHATVVMLAACVAIGFFMIIGKTYGIKKLKSLPFAAFSMAWLLVHVCLFLFVLGYLSFFHYLPVLIAELFVGFMAAIWLFGPPSHGST